MSSVVVASHKQSQTHTHTHTGTRALVGGARFLVCFVLFGLTHFHIFIFPGHIFMWNLRAAAPGPTITVAFIVTFTVIVCQSEMAIHLLSAFWLISGFVFGLFLFGESLQLAKVN